MLYLSVEFLFIVVTLTRNRLESGACARARAYSTVSTTALVPACAAAGLRVCCTCSSLYRSNTNRLESGACARARAYYGTVSTSALSVLHITAATAYTLTRHKSHTHTLLTCPRRKTHVHRNTYICDLHMNDSYIPATSRSVSLWQCTDDTAYRMGVGLERARTQGVRRDAR